MSVVEVDALRVELAWTGADIVDDISFAVDRGEILGIVGESGSGKTTVAHALLGHARARRADRRRLGRHRRRGHPRSSPADQLRKRRGKVVSYVPQDPPAALNPGLRIGKQLARAVRVPRARRVEAVVRERIAGALQRSRCPTNKEFLDRFPHQLSGGQQQRVVLAMAFILKPKLVVLDEPTTGLDVTTQAQVLARRARAVREPWRRRRIRDPRPRGRGAHRDALDGHVLGPDQRDRADPALFEAPAHPYTRRLHAGDPGPTDAAAVGVDRRDGAASRATAPADASSTRAVQHAVDACRSGTLRAVEWERATRAGAGARTSCRRSARRQRLDPSASRRPGMPAWCSR